MKVFKALCLISLLVIPPASFAFTYFQKGKAPSDILEKGNIYQNKNLYSTKDNLNAYSTFQSVYNSKSVRNNPQKYAEKVQTYDGVKQGYISVLNNSKGSITNPYGNKGNVYNYQHPSNPYRAQKWNNPYSKVQNPYNAKSFRNDNKYGLELRDSKGNILGYNHSKSYNSESIPDTYNHSPFHPKNTQNPYGNNKQFQ